MFEVVKWLLLGAALSAFCVTSANAQQVLNATSCSESAVASALNRVNQAIAVVTIPSGTCHWTSDINFTVPSGSTSLTIQGATTCTGSGDPTVNNLACTDRTSIVDDDTTDTNYLILLNLNSSATALVRVTGLTFDEGANTLENDAILTVTGSGGGQNFRLDHDHFDLDTYTGSNPTANNVVLSGCLYGVADHNIFDSSKAEDSNIIVFYNGNTCNGDSNGDGPWASATGYGGNQFFFVEQNRFNVGNTVGWVNDCMMAGKYVWRFNTGINAHLQTHSTGSANRQRGCRAQEIYKNSFTDPSFIAPATNAIYNVFFYSSGTALVWGNTAGTGYENFVTLHNCRSGSSGCGYNISAPPNGFGYCGSTNRPSAWDENMNGTSYACIDQPGRGQGDLLSGSFPNACDHTSGCTTFNGTWPNQKSEPLYSWLNSFSPLGHGNGSVNPVVRDGSGIWTQNRDYYFSSDENSGSDCSGFTGATGVGCGTFSSRPATCTTGVAYWATDQGNWNQSGNGAGNGELFKCTGTNTWTLYYTPYTYPDPLETDSRSWTPTAAARI